MRSPSLISRGMTFLFFHLNVSSQYLARLMAACILTTSMVSTVGFKSSSVASFASLLVLHDLSLISSRVTASSPYSNLNGVNFVALDAIVLCDQMTLESSSTHLPSGSSVMFFLMPVNMMPSALFSAPLDRGWYTEAKHKMVPSSVQNCLKVAQSNCLPLSFFQGNTAREAPAVILLKKTNVKEYLQSAIKL